MAQALCKDVANANAPPALAPAPGAALGCAGSDREAQECSKQPKCLHADGFLDFSALLRGKPMMDLDYLMHIMQHVKPCDFDKVGLKV